MSGLVGPTLFLILITTSGVINGYLPEPIYFPMRYVDRSIDLGISTDELNVQTGKCEESRIRDLSLIIPRSCAPRALYPGFINSDRVTCLSLRDSLIEQVSIGSFDRLPNLFYLDLSKNRIQFCDLLSFGGHSRLTTLIVDENGIIGDDSRGLIIDRADYFPLLEHLYLRKNLIRELRISLRRNFPILSHLYLSDNRLVAESFDYLDLPMSLTHLHLERNMIRRLESRTVRNLHFLFLDGNQISSICAINCVGSFLNLRGAVNLKFLSLAHNEISHIDRDSFAEACNLRSLSLSHNRLNTIASSEFYWLRELRDLSLSHNHLRVVPNLGYSTILMSLTLDHNEIERIDAGAFRDLRHLRWLTLNGNRISVVETGAFSGLTMLEELDLSDNELSHLAWSWIDSNSCLRLLDLRGNRLSTFDYLYLQDIGSLTDLYLQGNPLMSTGQTVYGNVRRNVSVHLEYGVTFTTRPCYVICDYDTRVRNRIVASDYWI